METGRKEPTAIKQPHTRLLDMLAGWSQFAQNDKEHPNSPEVIDALCALYQEAGNLDIPADREGEAEAVRAFVQTRVLPLMLK